MMIHKCNGCRYKGEHQEMGFRSFGVCTKETNLIKAEKAYNAEKCPYKQTNADRIRSMSDEELAWFLAKEATRIAKPVFDYCGMAVNEEVIFLSRLLWMREPAEECE